MLSIIIPYLSNSKCIDLCKEKIAENTNEIYEIVEIVDSTDVYNAYNRGAELAKYDNLVFLNDDMVVAPNWDKHIVENLKENMVMTQYLVECGHLDVNQNNIKMDFGRDVDTFDYNAFCQFVEAFRLPRCEHGFGWYMPFMIKKKSFTPYPNNIKYPHPNDMILFEQFKMKGYDFVRIHSFAYHFQGFSRRDWKNNSER